MIRRIGIYVREGDEQVGPFHSRQDAERFLILMELFGTRREGIELIEVDTTARPGCTEGTVLGPDNRSSVAVLPRRW